MKADVSKLDYRESMDDVHLGLRASILRVARKCLVDTSIEGLSVSTLCERAGISRPTFYRLFSDKYDVYNWYLRVSMRSSLAQVGVVFSWSEALIRFFRVMDANRETSQLFFAADDPRAPRYLFVDYVDRAITKNVKMRFPEEDEVPHRFRFQIRAFSRAFSAALVDWLAEDDPPYSMVDAVLSIVPHDLYKMLNVNCQGGEFNIGETRTADMSMLIEYVSEEVPTRF